jgi:hypothetical protein
VLPLMLGFLWAQGGPALSALALPAWMSVTHLVAAVSNGSGRWL